MPRENPASYVQTRKLGDATLSMISDGSGWSNIISLLVGVSPDVWRQEVAANDEGEVLVGYNVAHVQIGAASILIDLGFDDAGPQSQWGAPEHQRSHGAEAGLATLGIKPSDITHVLITHAHGDHVAGGTILHDGQRVARYPNARHFLGRADWEENPSREKPDSYPAVNAGGLLALGQLELVDGDCDIVPGVSLIHAPGESPGHSLIRVASAGETFYFLGDLFHHPAEVAHVNWVSRGRDGAKMQASRERLIEAAIRENALLATAHMPFPGLGRLERTAAGIRWHVVD